MNVNLNNFEPPFDLNLMPEGAEVEHAEVEHAEVQNNEAPAQPLPHMVEAVVVLAGLWDLAAQSRQAEVLQALAESGSSAQAPTEIALPSSQEQDDFALALHLQAEVSQQLREDPIADDEEFIRNLVREEEDLALARKLQDEEDARARRVHTPEKTTDEDVEMTAPGVEKNAKKRSHDHHHKHHRKHHKKH